MQILLLLPLLPLRRRRQIEERRTPIILLQSKKIPSAFIPKSHSTPKEKKTRNLKTYQVMKRKTAQLRRLDAQIPKRLGARVNDLIDELALNLIWGESVPPENLVQHVRHGLEHDLWYVEMASLLDDFAVDELGDFGGGVVYGAVELVGLLGGGVVFDHGG